MEKIQIGFMKDLRIHEFSELYCQIVHSIDADKIDDIYIKTALENVKRHVREVYYIEKPQRNAHTPIIREQIRLRTEYIMSLRKKTEGCLLSPIAEERKAAEVFYEMLSTFKKDLYKPTLHKQKFFVDWLVDDIEEWGGAREAIDYLGFQYIIDAIVEISASIQTHIIKRLDNKMEIQNRSEGLRALVYKDLKTFIDAISFMLQKHQNEEEQSIYYEISSDINMTLKPFMRDFKIRNSKRKNKKERQKEANLAVNELINSSQKIVQPEKLENHPIKEAKNLPMVIIEPFKLINTININDEDFAKQDCVNNLLAKSDDGELKAVRKPQRPDQNGKEDFGEKSRKKVG